ncbi:cytochrome c biogenesis protein CcdA [Escherichia coli]
MLIGLAIIFDLAGDVNVWPVQLDNSLLAANTSHDENRQQAAHLAARLLWGDCRTDPSTMHHRTAKRDLLYIAQSGNMRLGGGTLYLYALGMGLPLTPMTVFGNRSLPKSGPWMEQVKTAFGFRDPRTAGLPAGSQ